MKAVIFGINGQDGFYLKDLLKKNQIEVIGVSRSGNYIQGNVADLPFVENLVESHKPDFIFHLAANSSTKHEALFENHGTICTGTLNILESVRKHSPRSKVFLPGSAMQFRNEGTLINELTPFEAKSPYAVSRIQSVFAARYFRERFGIRVYTGFLFNHDSPFRSEKHISQKIAKAVQRIASGTTEIIEIGDPAVRKEFGFAGDIVEAIWTLINQENFFEAVIGTGTAYSIQEWITACFDAVGKKWQDHVVPIKDFVPEYYTLVSNPFLINSLGWHPKTSFKQLVEMMVKSE